MAVASTALMEIGGGVLMPRSQYLAGWRREKYHTLPFLDEQTDAAFDGTIDDLAEQYPEISACLYNNVKICPREACHKPCAFTMTACNSCGQSLDGVSIAKSENVFTAFLFGVRRANRGFPYRISLRRHTPEVLIIDDLLALSPIHFNAIPTTYIPDWRFLLNDPARGLRVLDMMEEQLWESTLPFLRDCTFRKVFFHGDPNDEEIKNAVLSSFNFPPSQFQLHIQWIMPPLMPFQRYMAEIRNHFHEDRCFPLSYVRKVLALNEEFPVTRDTPVHDIVEHFNGSGVDYKKEWAAFFEKCLRDCGALANWQPEDFRYVVSEGAVHEFSVFDGRIALGPVVEGVGPAELQAADKEALQSYGRPSNPEGSVGGTYNPSPRFPSFGPGGLGRWPGA